MPAFSRLFSKSKLDPVERFADGRWRSMLTGAPVLDGASASFDCEVEQRVASGTHYVYFGRVVAVTAADSETLIYRDGLFRRLAKPLRD